MKIIILPTADDVGRFAATKVVEIVSRKPAAVLGVATGSSPLGLYTDLRRRVKAGEISFATAHAFALDEYVGIPTTHPESYARVISRDVTEPLGFEPTRVRVPDGLAVDLDAAASKYDDAIRTVGGIDIQILGIGLNGHLGFNEPTSSFASRTRVTRLTLSSRQANTRFFEHLDDVPTHSVTQGIGTILEARELLLVAHGRHKAEAVAAAIEGPLTAFIPGSAIQLHKNVTVVLDEAAAEQLQLIDFYRAATAETISR